MIHTLTFESRLRVSPETAWHWITSIDGILKEMAPYMKMTVPEGVKDISQVTVVPGTPLFRSWVKLFGMIPIDYSHLTLVQLDLGRGFVEESPMGSMKLWRHERTIVPEGDGCRLVDRLTFEPRFLDGLTLRFIRFIFKHRHARLQQFMG